MGALMGATMLLKPMMIITLHKHVDQGKGMLMVAQMWTSPWKQKLIPKILHTTLIESEYFWKK
jgi:hypothetical protein